MERTDQVKKSVMNGFFEAIVRLSDQKYQERVWIRGEGPECNDFDEAYCYFFDNADSILDDYKSFNISDIQHKLLIQFCDALEHFADTKDWPEIFIGNPEWDVVTDLAQEVLKAFHYQKKTPEMKC